MTFSIQVLGTSSGIPLTFPCPSRDQPPPEAVGPVPCSHLSHRMHCISGGALQCNEHILHCVALFSLNRSPPPPCAVGFAAHAFSATSLQRCILLHMHRRRILQLGFELLYALVVQTALVQCTIILELVLNSCMHWCSALLCSHLECSTLPPDCRSFMHLAALPCLSAPHVVTMMLFRQIA